MVIHYSSNRKLICWPCGWAALTCSPRKVRFVRVASGDSDFLEAPAIKLNLYYYLSKCLSNNTLLNNALFIGLLRIK